MCPHPSEGTALSAPPTVTMSSAACENVSAPSASTTSCGASSSKSPCAAHAAVLDGLCAMTSGTSPEAAPVTRVCPIWSGSSGTISTSMPVASVNASTTGCCAAIRSGVVYGVQNTIDPSPSSDSPGLQADPANSSTAAAMQVIIVLIAAPKGRIGAYSIQSAL
nr:hypothetical protein GCM10025732_10010 [Glycomyces mayteni]